MILFGQIIVYIIMACAVIGCIASIVKPESELGKEFIAGIDSIGPIFLPTAGIMAAVPILTKAINNLLAPLYQMMGADAACAATTILPVDVGGYQLADVLAQSREAWSIAIIIGYMAGATIVFSLPVALKILKKEDRDYLALGVMCGFLAIPIAVLAGCAIIIVSNPTIREAVSTNSEATYQLAMTWSQLFVNLVPLIIFCGVLSLGLHFRPNQMIKGFNVFGNVLDALIKIIFVLCVVEYFTQIPSSILGNLWVFDPIIATKDDLFRALEVSGAIGIMLCGAFPMVWLIRRYLAKPLEKIGSKFGLSGDATAAILASSANVIAALEMLHELSAKNKVIVIAYSVCCSFVIGDHLSFTANFQPNLIFPVMAAKIVGGVVGIYFAIKLGVPTAEKIEGERLK